MDLRFKKKKETLIVFIKGELDLHTSNNLRKGIENKLQENSSLKNVILDLKGINFIDSSGLGAILGCYKKTTLRGGKLFAVSVSPQVKRIFELAGMLSIISVHETFDETKFNFTNSGY
ncbi:MAG: anti-sigma factor antagonist [Halanaerobiales bacterium]|nr:anti-sigma factor antagonist [Halanaerobiales bacterium]